jgi:hypothetical protein
MNDRLFIYLTRPVNAACRPEIFDFAGSRILVLPFDVRLVLPGPFFVDFDEDCADEAQQAVFAGEDPDFDDASFDHPAGWIARSGLTFACAFGGIQPSPRVGDAGLLAVDQLGQGRVQTWVKSQWKRTPLPGHSSAQV